MKKVIFLCLLSVSLCVSKPTDEAAIPASPPILNSSVPVKNSPESSTVPIPVPIPNLGLNTSVPIQTAQTTTKGVTEEASPVTEKSSQPIDNKTSEKKEQSKENSVNPTKATQEKSSTNKFEEAVTSTVTPAKEVTTKVTTTVVPVKDDATAHPIEGRPGFDGASFVGGIILTLGLLAITFMGFKYYKNHTERNYHTL